MREENVKNLQKKDSLYFKNYNDIEENYLESIFFQILRNSKNDEFSELDLNNLLNFSSYLNKRLFNIMKKENENNKVKDFYSNHKITFFQNLSSFITAFNKHNFRFDLRP